MRENMGLYRGKRKDNGEWVEGCLLYDTENNLAYIAECFEDRAAYIREVIPETVGQYTGKFDMNGRDIFEGDIISRFLNWRKENVNAVVKYNSDDASYTCYYTLGSYETCGFLADWVDGTEAKIIGNVWDNPELI